MVPALGNLSSIQIDRGYFGPAWLTLQKPIEITQSNDRLRLQYLPALMIDQSIVAIEIGDYSFALSQLESALIEFDFSEDTYNLARAEFHLGYALYNRGEQLNVPDDIRQSILHFETAVELHDEIDNHRGVGRSLNNIGYAYAFLGDFEQAMQALDQSLQISKQQSDRGGECRTLDSIGFVYRSTGDSDKALDLYFDALLCANEAGMLAAQYATLENIGRVFALGDKKALAITFLKRSINVIESIRADLQPLSVTSRQTYADKVAETYRLLAELLIDENRLPEAERALDLLKVEELNDYLGGLRGNDAEIPNLEGENKVWNPYAQLIADSISETRELLSLESVNHSQRTEAQIARVAELRAKRKEARARFQQLSQEPEVLQAIREMTSGHDYQALELELLQNLSEHLQANELLLYPLVLAKRVELIFMTKESDLQNVPVEVERADLTDVIIQFRQALRMGSDDVKEPGLKLYQ